ncbi:MAG TPA: hypothetical protein VKV16_03695 [Solirubrobacteraceae bacterium]|nr:hypothetical protein [Solirubrobacteraceae bacterium]
MTLIEVLVAALIVALIAVGTFSAFGAAGRTTSDTRAHAQATELAGLEEERLHGLPITELEQLGTKIVYRAENGDCIEESAGTWRYWTQGTTSFCENPTGLTGTTYTGTRFTVTSSTTYVTATAGSTSASLTCLTTAGASSYLQSTSAVTWPALGSRPAVTQSSIVSVPTSSTLLVKVLNQNSEGVSGATVALTGTTTLTRTTPSSGCLSIGGLTPGSANVQATESGYVNELGESSPTATSVTLEKNKTVEQDFHIAQAGKLKVVFKEAAAAHKEVSSDTFYALNSKIASPSGFVGGNTAATGLPTGSTSELSQQLYPFHNNKYAVFAGDCEKNNPALVNGALHDAEVEVTPNTTSTAELELPAPKITVYEGTSTSSPKLASSEHAMIVNVGCESSTARNMTSPVYEHEARIKAGALEPAAQPYAKELKLCVTAKISGKYYKDDTTFTNTVAEPTTAVNIFMSLTTPSTEHSAASSTPYTCP